MAEQLAFEQLRRKRRTIDDDEIFLRARAAVVDRARSNAFSCSALAEDQHGRIGVGDLAQRLQHQVHRRAFAVHFGDAGRAVLLFQRLDALLEPARAQLLARRHAQLFRRARLHQVVDCAGAYRVERTVDGGMRRHDHDPHPRRVLAQCRKQVETGRFAEAQVQEAQVEHVALHQLFGLGRIARRAHAMPCVLQAVAERAQDVLFVVNQKNPRSLFRARFCHCRVSSGCVWLRGARFAARTAVSIAPCMARCSRSLQSAIRGGMHMTGMREFSGSATLARELIKVSAAPRERKKPQPRASSRG